MVSQNRFFNGKRNSVQTDAPEINRMTTANNVQCIASMLYCKDRYEEHNVMKVYEKSKVH